MPRPKKADVALPAAHTIKLYDKQYAFVMHPAHHTALIGGIGSGKSLAGNIKAFLAAMGVLPSIPAPNLGVVTAPTYKMLDDATFRSFKDVAGTYLLDYNESKGLARMANGSEVIFRSTQDPDTLRGPSITWWHGDEAALSPYSVYEIMIGRLRQGGRQGYFWLTTTPKGKQWIYKLFVERFSNDPDYCLFRMRTADNPFVAPEYLAMLRENYSADYARQELDGEFVGWEGLVYPEFDRSRHVLHELPSSFEAVIAGVDWGFANAGVIQVLGLRDGALYHLHEEYAKQRGIDDWANVALQLRDLFNISAFYCDPSEPDYLRKFNERGCRALQANNTVSTGIQAVKRRLNTGTLQHYNSAVYTFAEYESYQWMRRGDQALDQPVKANDHALDALRYAVMGTDYARKPLTVAVKAGLG